MAAINRYGSLPNLFIEQKCQHKKPGSQTLRSQFCSKANLIDKSGFAAYNNQWHVTNHLSLSVESSLHCFDEACNEGTSNMSYNRRDLFEIAQEIHRYPEETKENLKSCSCKQYHSWPKHLRKDALKKVLTDKIYHNYGLNNSSDIILDQIHETPATSPSNSRRSRAGSKSKLVVVNKSQIENDIDSTTSDEYSESGDSGTGQCIDFPPYFGNYGGVHPPLFKNRCDMMLQWFSEFSDEQKNTFILKLLNASSLPQMHLLSLKMAPILHKDCPINCQDMLQWLPENVVYKIMGYLDPKSLSTASQVNRVWNGYANHSHLWQRFCLFSEYSLPPSAHKRQIEEYKVDHGRVKWREVFIERYLCKRNWKIGRYRVKTLIGHTQGVSCLQFDERRIVSGSSDNTIRVWDLNSSSGESIMTLVGHSGTVRCLHLYGNRLISGSADGTIKVWDLSVGSDWNAAACKVTMVGHSGTVRCLQADSDKVISGSYDKLLKVWDVKTGRCRLTLRGHFAGVLCVQFDEEKIVSGSADRTIRVWSIVTGACLAKFYGHKDSVTCLQFNCDQVISGSLDCTLKFWDLSNGTCLGTIDWITSEGHTRVVRCLQADNWKIVSGGDDKTLKVWSLKTGERFVTLHNHTDGVTCLQFNDFMIVSGSYDKSVKVWDFRP